MHPFGIINWAISQNNIFVITTQNTLFALNQNNLLPILCLCLSVIGILLFLKKSEDNQNLTTGKKTKSSIYFCKYSLIVLIFLYTASILLVINAIYQDKSREQDGQYLTNAILLNSEIQHLDKNSPQLTAEQIVRINSLLSYFHNDFPEKSHEAQRSWDSVIANLNSNTNNHSADIQSLNLLTQALLEDIKTETSHHSHIIKTSAQIAIIALFLSFSFSLMIILRLKKADSILIEQNDKLSSYNASLQDQRLELEAQKDELEATTESLSSAISMLEHASRRFQELFQGLPVACFTMDNEGTVFEWNDACENLLGYSTNAIFQRNIWDTICKTNDSITPEQIKTVFQGNVLQGYEHGFIRQDESRASVISNIFPFRGADGQITAVICASVDISARLEIETTLKRNVELMRTLLDTIPHPIFVKDNNFRYILLNRTFEEYFGISPNEYIGKSVYDLFPKEKADVFNKADLDLFNADGNQIYSTTVLNKDKEERDILFSKAVFHDENDEKAGIIGILQDVTESNKTMDELKTLSLRMQLAAKSANIGIWDYNLTNNQLIWDDKMFELYDVDKETSKGIFEEWANRLHPDDYDSAMNVVTDTIANKDGFHMEFRVVHQDGSVHYLDGYSIVTRSPVGVPLSLYGINKDITQRKTNEEALRNAEAKFRNLVEQSNVGVYIIQDSKTVYANPRLLEILGYDIDEILQLSSLFELIAPEDRELVANNIKLREEGKLKSIKYECCMLHKNGHRVNVEACGTVTVMDGKPAIIGSLLDITSRKRAEQEIKERLDYEEALTSSLQVLLVAQLYDNPIKTVLEKIIEATSASRICYFENKNDPEMGKCLHLTHQAVKQGTAEKLFIQGPVTIPLKNGLDHINKNLGTEQICINDVSKLPEKERLFFESIHVKSVLILPVFVDNEWYGTIGFDVCDNTHDWSQQEIKLLKTVADMIGVSISRKKSRNLLIQNEKRLRTILDTTGEGILAIDEYGVIETFNTAATDIFKYSQNEIIGKNINVLFSSENNNPLISFLNEYNNNSLSSSSIKKYETIGLRKNGDEFPVELAINFVAIGNQTVFVLSFRDITDRKDYELQIDNQMLEANQKSLELECNKMELEKANNQLFKLATTDGLTGLTNHRTMQEMLSHEFQTSVRYNRNLSIALLDVDKFKNYNDMYGHPAGDELLKGLSKILDDCSRDSDVTARYGGEEFMVIMPETDKNGAIMLAERIRQAVENHQWAKGLVTISIGVSSLDNNTFNAAELIKEADKALYHAKEAGRNRTMHFNNINSGNPDGNGGLPLITDKDEYNELTPTVVTQAIICHLQWINRLKSLVNNEERLPMVDKITKEQCRLEKWIASNKEILQMLPSFDEMEKAHMTIHQFGNQLFDNQENSHETLKTQMMQITDHSENLVSLLEKIKQELSEYSLDNAA